MSKDDIQQPLLETLELFAKKAADSVNAPVTIKAEIVEELDAGAHKYSVYYGGVTYKDAYALANMTYTPSTIVYVLIPDGDFDSTKFILNAVDPNADVMVGEVEEDNYIPITDDLILSDKIINLNSWDNIEDINQMIDLNNSNFKNLFSHYYKDYKTFLFSARIKTEIDVYHQKIGNYGLKLRLPFTQPNDSIEGNKELIFKDFIIDVSNMMGDPYNYTEYQTVNVYFTIDDTLELVDINDENSFTIIPFVKDFGYVEAQNKDPDIHIKDVKLYMIDTVSEENKSGYYLTLKSDKGTIFIDDTADDKIVTPILRVNGRTTSLTDYRYYWYVWDPYAAATSTNVTSYNIGGSVNWKCLNEVEEVAADDKGNVSYQYITSNYSLIVKPTDVFLSKKYKCVLVKPSTIEGQSDTILSAEMIFTNLKNNNIKTSLFTTTGSVVYSENIGKVNLVARYEYPNFVKQNVNIGFEWNRYNQNGEYIDNDFFYIEDGYGNIIKGKYLRFNEKVSSNVYETEIQFGTKDIEKVNTIYCTFYKIDNQGNREVISTESITITTDPEINFIVTIYGGDRLYNYDDDGDSPLVTAYQGPVSTIYTNDDIEPLTFKVYKLDGTELTESDYYYCHYKWKLPVNSMMTYPDISDENKDESGEYYIIEGIGQSSPIRYNIKPTYNKANRDNTIFLEITFNNDTITTYTTIKFLKNGENGTNGSRYAAYITYTGPSGEEYYYGQKNENGSLVKAQMVYVKTESTVEGVNGWKVYDVFMDVDQYASLAWVEGNPKEQGLYEYNENTKSYFLTKDTEVDDSKTYYILIIDKSKRLIPLDGNNPKFKVHVYRDGKPLSEASSYATITESWDMFDSYGSSPCFDVEKTSDGCKLIIKEHSKQEVDADGNPIYDADGNPVYIYKKDANGNIIYDEDGKPVKEMFPYDWEDGSKNYCNIVQVRVEVGNDGTYDEKNVIKSKEVIYVYYPIEISRMKVAEKDLKNLMIPTFAGGYEEVLYSSDGKNPLYDNNTENPFECTDSVFENNKDTLEYIWYPLEANNLNLIAKPQQGTYKVPTTGYDNITVDDDGNLVFWKDGKKVPANGKRYYYTNKAKVTPVTNYDANIVNNFVSVTLGTRKDLIDIAKAKQQKLKEQRGNATNGRNVEDNYIEYLNNFKGYIEDNGYTSADMKTDLSNCGVLLDYRYKLIKIIYKLDEISDDDIYKVIGEERINALGVAYKHIYNAESISDFYMLNDSIKVNVNNVEGYSNFDPYKKSQCQAIQEMWNGNIEGYNEIIGEMRERIQKDTDFSNQFNIFGNIKKNLINLPNAEKVKNINQNGLPEFKNLYTQLSILCPYLEDCNEDSLSISNKVNLASFENFSELIVSKICDLIEKSFNYIDNYVKARDDYQKIIDDCTREIDSYDLYIYQGETDPAVKLIKPIIMLTNRYELSYLNDWDGSRLYTGEADGDNKAYIVAPMVGAGYKDTDNNFTGLIMGLKRFNTVKDTASYKDQKIGLIGFNKNEESLFINAKDGSAIFGKNGKGQVIIDPSQNKALIYSSNYFKNNEYAADGKPSSYSNIGKGEDGMLINLTNSYLHLGKYDGYIYSGGHTKIDSTNIGFYLSYNGLSITNRYKVLNLQKENEDGTPIYEETVGSFHISTDIASKTEYIEIKNPTGNPKNNGWYEYDKVTSQYTLTNDTYVKDNKIYYQKQEWPSVNGSSPSIFSNNHSTFNSSKEGYYIGQDGISIVSKYRIGQATSLEWDAYVGDLTKYTYYEGNFEEIDVTSLPEDVDPKERGYYEIEQDADASHPIPALKRSLDNIIYDKTKRYFELVSKWVTTDEIVNPSKRYYKLVNLLHEFAVETGSFSINTTGNPKLYSNGHDTLNSYKNGFYLGHDGLCIKGDNGKILFDITQDPILYSNNHSNVNLIINGFYLGNDGMSIHNFFRVTSSGLEVGYITGDSTITNRTWWKISGSNNQSSITFNAISEYRCFKVDGEGKITFDGASDKSVYIGTDGIRLGTGFAVDNDGNGFLKGHIEGKTGTIGGWIIQNGNLYSADPSQSASTANGYIVIATKENGTSAPQTGIYVIKDAPGVYKDWWHLNMDGSFTVNSDGSYFGNIYIDSNDPRKSYGIFRDNAWTEIRQIIGSDNSKLKKITVGQEEKQAYIRLYYKDSDGYHSSCTNDDYHVEFLPIKLT